MRSILFCFALAIGSHTLFAQTAGSNPLVRFHTDLGDIDVVLLKDIAPNNVANFLGYVNPSIYDNSFIHRSVQDSLHSLFIIQGGGYDVVSNQITALPVHAAVVNEFHVSNKRGTIAMAKVAGNPNSATNNWFFNVSDVNAPNLDTQNGGFTVFGRIVNNTGLTTMDTIATVPTYNAQDLFGSDFQSWPLLNYTGTIQNANLVHVIWVKVVPQISALTHPSANTIHVQGIGGASKSYQLQTSSTPASSGFTNLSAVTADANGNIAFNDNSAGTGKFYRLTIP